MTLDESCVRPRLTLRLCLLWIANGGKGIQNMEKNTNRKQRERRKVMFDMLGFISSIDGVISCITDMVLHFFLYFIFGFNLWHRRSNLKHYWWGLQYISFMLLLCLRPYMLMYYCYCYCHYIYGTTISNAEVITCIIGEGSSLFKLCSHWTLTHTHIYILLSLHVWFDYYVIVSKIWILVFF